MSNIDPLCIRKIASLFPFVQRTKKITAMEEANNVFSIKDLENFSGIKAHTIRIWEKRYRILEPDRTDSNIRTYNESELKKILNVAYLNKNGFKISKIAKLDEDELTQKVMTVSSGNDSSDNDFQPGKILMAAIRFNENQFRDALMPYVASSGLENAYCRYFYPLLEKARILWQTGSLSRAQEQFIRYSIRQIIITEEYKIKDIKKTEQKPVVAMVNTSDSYFENNFLFYKYALRKRGYDVVYTGGILPASEIAEIYRIKPFDYLLVNSGSYDFSEKKILYITAMGKSLKISKIFLTDLPEEASRIKYEKIIPSRNPIDFLKAIDSL